MLSWLHDCASLIEAEPLPCCVLQEPLFEECARAKIELVRFSIPDGRVPRDCTAAVRMARRILELVREKKTGIVLHMRSLCQSDAFRSLFSRWIVQL